MNSLKIYDASHADTSILLSILSSSEKTHLIHSNYYSILWIQHWNLIRRREFHKIFNNKLKTALVPMLDLRGATPQYIFVRKTVPGANPNTFPEKSYYRSIPGVSGNGVVQNPQY